MNKWLHGLLAFLLLGIVGAGAFLNMAAAQNEVQREGRRNIEIVDEEASEAGDCSSCGNCPSDESTECGGPPGGQDAIAAETADEKAP